ncbi:MAG TPA: hypothetical protein VGA42_07825 [Gemmatimonadales bacterium]|jgi:uncharacterized membrane protein YdjX (TVP38/TMEM64 family)
MIDRPGVRRYEKGGRMSNFALYLIGTILITAAVVFGADLLGLQTRWIIVIALLVLGLGVTGGVAKTRQKQAPPPPQ